MSAFLGLGVGFGLFKLSWAQTEASLKTAKLSLHHERVLGQMASSVPDKRNPTRITERENLNSQT